MRVYVVYSSGQIATRIIRELMNAPSMTLVGQCRDSDLSFDVIRSSCPDIVVLQDVRMPADTFRTVVRQLKAEPSAPRILIMTDSPYPQFKRECLRIGADHVYETPTEVVGMVEALQDNRINTRVRNHGEMS